MCATTLVKFLGLGIWWPPSDLRDLQSVHFIWQAFSLKNANIILKYQQKDDTTLQKHIPKVFPKKSSTGKEKKTQPTLKIAAPTSSCSYEVNQEQAEGVRNGTVNRGKGLGSAHGWREKFGQGYFLGCWRWTRRLFYTKVTKSIKIWRMFCSPKFFGSKKGTSVVEAFLCKSWLGFNNSCGTTSKKPLENVPTAKLPSINSGDFLLLSESPCVFGDFVTTFFWAPKTRFRRIFNLWRTPYSFFLPPQKKKKKRFRPTETTPPNMSACTSLPTSQP